MNVEIENIPRILHVDACFSTKTWVKEPAKLILASNSKQIPAKTQTKDHRIHKFSILMHYIYILWKTYPYIVNWKNTLFNDYLKLRLVSPSIPNERVK